MSFGPKRGERCLWVAQLISAFAMRGINEGRDIKYNYDDVETQGPGKRVPERAK